MQNKAILWIALAIVLLAGGAAAVMFWPAGPAVDEEEFRDPHGP